MGTTKRDAAWAAADERCKAVWERHAAGETYTAIAQTLGISSARVRQLSQKWERILSHRARNVSPIANVRAEPI